MSGTQLNYWLWITDAAQVFWGGEVGAPGDTLRALQARPVSFRMLYTSKSGVEVNVSADYKATAMIRSLKEKRLVFFKSHCQDS